MHRVSLVVFLAYVCSASLAWANPWDANQIVNWVTYREAGFQYGLRGIALSPDQNYIYGAWMHGDGIRWLYRYDAVQTSGPDTNPAEGGTRHYIQHYTFNNVSVPKTNPDGSPNLVYDNNTDWRSVTVTNQYVYAGLDQEHRTGTPDPDSVYGFKGFAVLDPTANWTPAVPGGPSPAPVYVDKTFDSGVNGIVATDKYLYMTLKDDATTQSDPNKRARVLRYRIDVTPRTPTLDTTWGTNGVFDITSATNVADGSVHTDATNLRGMVVDQDGNIYIASSTTVLGATGRIYKITPSYTVTFAELPNPTDIAIYQNTLFVTEYNGQGSKLHKFNYSLNDLGGLSLATFPGTPSHLYNASPALYNPAGGYSSIDISNAGRVYLSDQYWNDQMNPDYPLIDSDPSHRFLLTDRLYLGDPLPEPGTLALFGLGLPALAVVLRRKRKAASGGVPPGA